MPRTTRKPSPQHAATRPAAAQAVWLGVVACFALSGFAALLYQTAWLRQLSLSFGTSELAVAAVLAAYMAGLALGAALAGRFLARIRRPILVYGALEAGIAGSALAVPGLLALADAAYAAWLGGRPAPPDAAALGQTLFQLVVAFLVLALPTACMGATLPLLVRHAVHADRELGARVARLYAANTAGAVLGALAAGFVLLPALGLRGTVWVGVAVNAVVFAVAAALSRRAGAVADAANASEVAAPPIGFIRSCIAPLFGGAAPLSARARAIFAAQPAWILPLVLMSGATAFLYEVLWTRLLSHVLGGSIASFATMLAAFLSGIALGGGLAGRFAASRAQAATGFGVAQLAIALLSLGVYACLGPLLPASRELAPRVLYAIAVLLPATVFIGATFPLAVRVLAREPREAGPATARIYAWNTVGAIAGAILGAFFVLPGLGFEGAIRLAVCANLALGLFTLACVAPRRRAWVGAAALGLAAGVLFYRPARPEVVVSRTAFAIRELSGPRETFQAVGRSATVALLEQAGFSYLLTNGLPEAAIAARGSPPFRDAQQWLTALPVVARPDAASLLMVGLGGGVALEDAPPSLRRIDVIELEPEVVRANRSLAERRNRDPLADPRLSLVLNDARNALRLTVRRWDVIVSQPSHPWTAGASHLFTREFVASARAHLAPGGVFVQWMNSDFVTAPLLASLVATLRAEFAHLRLYQPQPQVLIFLASEAPLEPELSLLRTGRPLADAAEPFSRLGIGAVEDLVAALALDERGLEAFARGAPIATDDRNPMATQSRSGGDGLRQAELDALLAPHDPLRDAGSAIHTELGHELDWAYVVRTLARRGQAARAEAVERLVADPSTRSLLAARRAADGGDHAAAREALRAAVAARPANAQARFLLLTALGSRAPELRSVLAGLEGPARAVVDGWQHQAQGDWRALSALDAALGRSRTTDVWYTEAARLRALWRARTADGDGSVAAEALRLLDPALVVAGDAELFGLYQLRAESAAIAGDADVLVESSRDIVASVRGNLERTDASGAAPHPAQLALMRQSLAEVADRLARELPDGTRERAAEVLADARAGLARIDAVAARLPQG